MRKRYWIFILLFSAAVFTSCSDGFLKPYADHDERLFGTWSNYSTDTMEGDAYFFYSDFTFRHLTYNGWKDKDNFEYYNPTIKEGSWSTKEGKLRLSTELFDKNYEITMRDAAHTYLLVDKNEYLKI